MSDLPLVLLTNPIHPDATAMLAPHARLLVAPDTEAATLRALAADAAGIIVRAKLPDDIVAHAPRLKGLVRHGVGLDFVPVAAATAAGIPVANLPGINTRAVAEYVFAALLSLRRTLHVVDRQLRGTGWNAARGSAGEEACEIGGSTLGILGTGVIGRRIAEIAQHGFGMRVLGHSRRGSTLDGLVEPVDRERLFSESDAIVVVCPLTDETHGLVSAALIARMPRHAVLINVARGPVVDTNALVAALKAGAIAGAAIDVFDIEPLAADHPLRSCPDTMLTPHVAGITATSMRAMSMGAAEEMLRILRGEPPLNFVNPAARLA